ncbi:MAG: hypothetical protein A3B74_03840 [Candidatus Kerfeldbacteria bacterium RIFCSPHIGHO2_02_FULL_42_14]|uniref:Glycosyltransferase 2-like domain-containing protein n=1 Tax=Candidatus Kerfeldbacteria bacterium RIFCSPHIGHO2_02_FULL_42_14 TaxID=1798540 RepID=A0A1G2AQ29_9BACT|nr:MAG: hypothetical protein A3B74_03840 [Candidatus Kerfeldbacteria bacterium RIFCSPHIGHO2_02_FULL_42_14]OGY80645.1 MAG: hypothetical protein A3E60_04340 [Candidatus Kerfeldbacteria bacterium RIFCSPHIGHO2_12_FULL_42_13]OGY82569.1 MAG: hypothetical protein A3I91_04000 [Candidatus Kerfeldbacteria bacterium RIFCSPLOWO2_02_FULL_42_19]OGY85173.1 MAG: hypothetical protein A3G01_01130 [Candidatus Kerfeldbacteria bacterium RIFCSPLOWO2_12_FULL_43_9]
MDFCKVSIIIVTYNSARYIRPLLASIVAQTEKSIEVIVVDNASQDETVAVLEKEYTQTVRVIKNPTNDWFSKGYNRGIRESHGEYVLICNHDVILMPDFLEKLLQRIESDPKIACVGGKVLKFPQKDMEFTYDLARLNSLRGYFKIDTTGIQVFRNRRFIDRGESEEDRGQYNREEEVFGFSGALVLLRRAALETVKFEEEYFDEDMIAYKEDVDMAWRLRHAGFTVWYVAKALAYHNRRVSRDTGLGMLATIQNRRGKFHKDSFFSYKNHWHVLIKNDTFANFFKDSLFIFWYELRKFIYILCFEPHTLAAIPQFFREFPRMRKKRSVIFSNSKLSNASIRRWFL